MSDDSVVKLADVSKSAEYWSPKDMLEYVLEGIESGAFENKKALVIMLDDSDRDYYYQYMNAGLSYPNMVALLEAVKHEIVKVLSGDLIYEDMPE